MIEVDGLDDVEVSLETARLSAGGHHAPDGGSGDHQRRLADAHGLPDPRVLGEVVTSNLDEHRRAEATDVPRAA